MLLLPPSSASRQVEPNSEMWLATRAGKMEWFCPLGIPYLAPTWQFRCSPSRCMRFSFAKYFPWQKIFCWDESGGRENWNAPLLLHVTAFLFRADVRQQLWEGVLLPCMGYLGICNCEGFGFQAVYSCIGYIKQSVPA